MTELKSSYEIAREAENAISYLAIKGTNLEASDWENVRKTLLDVCEETQHLDRELDAAKSSLTTLQAENEKLREGLEVLALNEGMTSSFRVRNNNEGKELMARLDFARNLLKGGE